MFSYQTLIGRLLSLHDLTPLQAELVQRLLELHGESRREVQEAIVVGSATVDHEGIARQYSSRARQIIRDRTGRLDAYLGELAGPVGELYRDGYYRIVHEGLEPEKREAFLAELRFNPARLLHDAYLDGTISQRGLAEKAELDSGTLSRLFTSLHGEDRPAGVTLKRLGEAFENLEVIPILEHQGPSEPALIPDSFGFTSRELRLISLAVALNRVRTRGDLSPKKRIVALNLAAIMGASDPYKLESITRRFIDHIKLSFQAQEPRAEAVAAAVAEAAVNPNRPTILIESEDRTEILFPVPTEDTSLISPATVFVERVREVWAAAKETYDSWRERWGRPDPAAKPAEVSALFVRRGAVKVNIRGS